MANAHDVRVGLGGRKYADAVGARLYVGAMRLLVLARICIVFFFASLAFLLIFGVQGDLGISFAFSISSLSTSTTLLKQLAK